MVALNFKAEFVDRIDGGEKTRTIRQTRKAGNPKRGDLMQLYTGMRTKKCEKIRDVICTSIRPVLINHMGVVLDGRHLWAGDAPAYQGGPQPDYYDGDFARADGFDCFGDMLDFFDRQYGLPFEGQLIEWSLALAQHQRGPENG
ncbi:MAG TPA: hypothetical protein VK494_09455 [Gemmatimonadaceae bacterium]|nr:hypothetical protein [Gemmatimonadaceae bacterium]